MVWVLAVIVVGLIAVIAELFLSYQKRPADLRLKQDPIRAKIRAHQKAMQESVERIQGAAEDQLQELDRELPLRGQQVDGFARDLRDAELEIFGEDYDPRAAAKDATDFLSEGEDKDEEKEEEKDPNLEHVETARDLLSEMEGHAASLKRDIEVVKQTLGDQRQVVLLMDDN
jgi:hypothetical protein